MAASGQNRWPSPGTYMAASVEDLVRQAWPSHRQAFIAFSTGFILDVSPLDDVAVGMIGDLFGDVGFDEIRKTTSNAEGVARTIEAIRAADERTFIWTNLVDFDQLYGHRNDAAGFARALEDFDRALPEIVAALPDGARLLLTADHGNDPCFPGTDHTREHVPILLLTKGAPGGRDLGLRATFADHAAAVADHFGVAFGVGESFL